MLQKLDRPAHAEVASARALALSAAASFDWFCRGWAFAGLSHYEEALIAYDQSRQQDDQDSDTWHAKAEALQALGREDEAQARELANLGISDRLAENLVQARAELTEALALARQIQEVLRVAQVFNSLGWLAQDEGDISAACRSFREALARFEQVGSPEAEEPRAQLRELGCDG